VFELCSGLGLWFGPWYLVLACAGALPGHVFDQRAQQRRARGAAWLLLGLAGSPCCAGRAAEPPRQALLLGACQPVALSTTD